MGFLGSSQRAAIRTGLIRHAWFGKLDFVSGAMRLCTVVGNISYDGHQWRGIGEVTDVSALKQMINGAASRMTIGLSGVSDEVASKSLGEIDDVIGRDITIYLGLMDSNYQVIGALRPVWLGTMETVRPLISGGTPQSSRIAVECATLFSVRRRSKQSLYSDRQQRQISEDDEFCARTNLYRFGQKQFPY